MANVWVLGAGWGTALAIHMNRNGHDTTLWTPFSAEIEDMRQYREHRKLLPGAHIDESIEITDDLDGVISAELIIIATPSFAVRETAERLRSVFAGTQLPVIACLSKGLEGSTLLRLSEVITETISDCTVVSVSGPSHAEEVARGIPTSLVAASADISAAETVQELMMGNNLRVYTNTDIIGVELGGALKNIIALAAGISDGMGMGDNTKAALMTRGLSEIARLGVAMGAHRDTFAGLSGIGDLIVTCTSMHSRNRRCGILIGKGVSVSEALEQISMTVEGYHAARIGNMLSEKYKVEMPIISQCYDVLYNGSDASDAIKALMTRPKKNEQEHTFFED